MASATHVSSWAIFSLMRFVGLRRNSIRAAKVRAHPVVRAAGSQFQRHMPDGSRWQFGRRIGTIWDLRCSVM